MAFRFRDKGPPPPPKDEQYAHVSSSSSASIMTAKNKLSIAALLTKIPNPLAASRDPGPSPNDDGISLPWNFQHHVHVDEGYVGLPPSWLTAAFSEDEIAQIQARRTAVLHGHTHSPLRPPSPTSSLYPSVVQGHRRNKSSVDSTASSSVPNLALSSRHPMSLSSTNLASVPPSPSVPLPLRSPSPAPSTHPQQPPSTPSSSSFSLAPRNILSDLSSASSNIVGKGMRMFRVKRQIGSGSRRKNVHSRLSDETFFPPEVVSPDRVTLGSPTSPPVAPVWEMYSTSKRPPTTTSSHQPQPSTSSSIRSQLSKKSSLRRPNPSTNLSRTPSLKNPPVLSRSKSQSSTRSLPFSPTTAHSLLLPMPSTTPPRPAPQPPSSHSTPGSSSSTTQPSHTPYRPPHLLPSHSHSASLTSLVSIPEASPAPGAVVPVPVPAMPTVFGKSSLSRKSVLVGSKKLNGSSSSQHQHHPNPSISSTSSTPYSRSRSNSQPHQQNHKHTPSNSSQQSSSSIASKQSNTSISQSSASSHSHDAHIQQQVPVLSLSLPRMSFSLPFGEVSFLAVGGETAGPAGGTPWPGSTGFGQASSSGDARLGKSGITTTIASGSGTTKKNGSDHPEPPPKPISIYPSITAVGGASSSTSNLTSTLRVNLNVASTSTPNLMLTSIPNLATSTPKIPSNASTSTPTTSIPIPIPKSKTSTTPPMSTPTGTGTSPARRRPLPSSKPLPSYPVPALPPIPPPNSKDTAVGMTKLMPVPPTPFSSFHPSVGPRHHLPPLPPVASGSGSGSDANPPHPPPKQQQPATTNSLLSPPTMFSPTAGNTLSPPLTTGGKSAAQSPNSAQLWSEIAQMMDPGMMSAIPGLHLSTALPDDVRDVVRRAGEAGGSGEEANREAGAGAGRKEEQRGGEVLVGDLVGPSPPVSAAELGGGVKEGSRVQQGEDVDSDSGSEEYDYEDESYDGVVQSASVVVALPHPHTHSPTQPLTIPIIPRVIEPLRTVGRPRLVNVNVNGVEQTRLKEDKDVELDRQTNSGQSNVENRDTIRSSTATIVPSRGGGDLIDLSGVNGQGVYPRTQQYNHRPPSMKLLISNGIGHGAPFAESPAMATIGTGKGTSEEGGGGNMTSTSTPFLSYYLDDGTPSPLPSPGSALGSPLHDESGDEGGSGSAGGFGFGFGSESTATSSYSGVFPGRRFEYEFDDEEEYRLSYREDDGSRKQNERVGGSEEGSEDDFYVEEDTAPAVKTKTRALPSTTPTITLNDGVHSPANDDDTKKAPVNGVGAPVSSSTSIMDLNSPILSPFQQRYYGWVSTLVAPLSEFIDDAVDPRDHYLDLTEIAEGDSGSVYAARVNKSNARKLRLGEVVRMQDLDDLGLGGDAGAEKEGVEKEEEEEGDEKEKNGGEEPMKLVAIKSIALVPSGTPKLVDLERELNLMKGLWHSQILSVDAVYVDLMEDSVWLRMELMERSLADVVVLVESGLVLQERTIARFASDVLLALEFLSRHNIVHRDVRSDNMLVNNLGVLKLADFTNAVRIDPSRPLHTDVVGVPYWQAPELLMHDDNTSNTTPSSTSNTSTSTGRTVPPYDPLKLDVWSLGSTVWEMAETVPPFFNTNKFEDRWPPLSQPALYSPAFHEFLRKCSEPAGSRPSAAELLQAPFINNACGRPVIVQLLAQCRTIEWALRETN